MKFYKMTKNINSLQILYPEELEALKQLCNDKSIVIKKADKGSNLVIMNRDEYIAEVERQLNDTKFYENLMKIHKNNSERI